MNGIGVSLDLVNPDDQLRAIRRLYAALTPHAPLF
jgi:hypothetical protein